MISFTSINQTLGNHAKLVAAIRRGREKRASEREAYFTECFEYNLIEKHFLSVVFEHIFYLLSKLSNDLFSFAAQRELLSVVRMLWVRGECREK